MSLSGYLAREEMAERVMDAWDDSMTHLTNAAAALRLAEKALAWLAEIGDAPTNIESWCDSLAEGTVALLRAVGAARD